MDLCPFNKISVLLCFLENVPISESYNSVLCSHENHVATIEFTGFIFRYTEHVHS